MAVLEKIIHIQIRPESQSIRGDKTKISLRQLKSEG